MPSTRALLAVSLISVACSGAPPPRVRAEAPPSPPERRAEPSEPSAAPAEPPVPDCPLIEIAAPFEVTGVSPEQGREDAAIIARDLHRLIASVNRGAPVPLLVARHDRDERVGDAAPASGPLCVRRIVRARYPNDAHWARVDAELARGERVHTLELEVWRRDGIFALALDRALRDLDELERLERARAFVERRAGARIRQEVQDGLRATWITLDGAAPQLCLSVAAERDPDAWSPPVATRCFEAPASWELADAMIRPILPPEEAGPDAHPRGWYVCLASRERGERLLEWPSARSVGGTCDRGPDGRAPRPLALTPVDAPDDLDDLERTRVDAIHPRLVVLSTRYHHALCALEGSLACHVAARQTEWVEWTRAVFSRDRRWVAVERSRDDEPGASLRAGDRAVFLLRREGGALVLAGVLPIGAFTSERGGERWDGERMRWSWSTRDTRGSARSVDANGCIEVTRARARRPGLSRPGRVDGHDPRIEDLYDATERDYSGAWALAPGGGLSRVARCPR